MKLSLLILGVVGAIALSQANPGFILRITPFGMNYANGVAQQVLNTLIRSLPIPDFSASSGRARMEASQLTVRDYNNAPFSYSLDNGRFQWTGNNADVVVTGRWRGVYESFFGDITASGGFTGDARNTRIHLNVRIARSPVGLFKLEDLQCDINIGDLDMDINGGFAGFILNLLAGIASGPLTTLIQDQLCSSALGSVIDLANGELESFPTNLDVAGLFNADYSVISDPVLTVDHVDSFHKGEIKVIGSQETTPFQPAPIDTTAGDMGKMGVFYASDYVLNSLLYHGHVSGFTQTTISKEAVPQFADLLNFDCGNSPVCLGAMFPPLQEQFPNGHGEMFVQTSQLPVAQITPQFGQMDGGARLVITAIDGDRRVEAVEMTVEARGLFIPQIINSDDGPKVTAQAQIQYIRATELISHIGELSEEQVQFLLDQFAPLFTLVINNELQQGFPIPELGSFGGIRDPSIVLQQGSMVLSSNVEINIPSKYTQQN